LPSLDETELLAQPVFLNEQGPPSRHHAAATQLWVAAAVPGFHRSSA
jgi:hypothetical protein